MRNDLFLMNSKLNSSFAGRSRGNYGGRGRFGNRSRRNQRGGRGGGRSNNTTKKKSVEKEFKFHPLGGGKVYASFNQTLSEVVLIIQKSWTGGLEIARLFFLFL